VTKPPFTLVVATLGILSAALSATPLARAEEGDEPWTAREFSRSELIDFGTHDETPLAVPWKTLRVEEDADRGGVDFRHVLEADYVEVRDHFEEAFERGEPALALRPWAAPEGGSRDLKVLGITTRGETRIVTLGNADTRRRYTVKLTEDDGETVLVYDNTAYTRTFGAGVPVFAPFRPVDTDSVPVED